MLAAGAHRWTLAAADDGHGVSVDEY